MLNMPTRIDLQQHAGLAVASETRETDHFAFVSLKRRAVRAGFWQGTYHNLCCFSFKRFFCDLPGFGCRSHGDHQGIAGKVLRHAFGNGLAVLHHHDAVAHIQNLAEEMGNKNNGGTTSCFRFHEGEQLTGGYCVQRGCRFVQNHQSQWFLRDGEGAGDFHHLAFADGQAGRFIIGRNAMARKYFVEFGFDQGGRA
jgi:hypothetical protein